MTNKKEEGEKTDVLRGVRGMHQALAEKKEIGEPAHEGTDISKPQGEGAMVGLAGTVINGKK